MLFQNENDNLWGGYHLLALAARAMERQDKWEPVLHSRESPQTPDETKDSYVKSM
jgi:hypothetical protein